MTQFNAEQRTICDRYGANFQASPFKSIIGLSRTFRTGDWPLNGLRHPHKAATCGWYVWSGPIFSTDPDFFVPIHVEHLLDRCPTVLPFLGLAPGWRFLLALGHEDVWFDQKLLAI
jgi:hypothetical protein